jgi:serine protease AprX
MALPGRLRISVHVGSRQDRDAAASILRTVDGDIHHYDGLVTGWATREAMNALMQRGFMIDESSAEKSAPPPPPPEPPPLPGSPDVKALTSLADELQAKVEATGPGSGLKRAGPLARFAAKSVDTASHAVLAATEGIFSATGGRFGTTMKSLSKGVLGAGAALPVPVTTPEEIMYEVQLTGPMRPDWADKLRACNARIASYVPPFRYRMPLTPDQSEQVKKLDFVEGLERYGLKATLGQAFLQALQDARQTSTSVPLTFDMTVHLRQQIPALHRLLERRSDVTLLETSSVTIRFQARIADPFLITLADREEVKTLDVYTPPVLLDYGRTVIGASAINGAIPRPWDGAGEVVAIIDSGVDTSHPDLTDRIKSYESVPNATTTDAYGHGTHVAGIIAGTGKASSGQITGVAPGAQLSVLGIVNANGQTIFPADLSNYLTRATSSGAKIVNMSLGFKQTNGIYDVFAQSIDQFVYDNPDVLIVVAAGNDGSAHTGYPDYRSVNSPATANNVIAVGACNSSRPGIAATWGAFSQDRFPQAPVSGTAMAGTLAPAGLSSRGPSEKESIKPDVLAPGTFVLSAQATGAALKSYADVPAGTGPYIFLNGTSMAAPFVSGAAAILRQYLREQMQVASPSAALLKAMLCASTRRCSQLVNPAIVPGIGYPDFDQGFGVVNLGRLIPYRNGSNLRTAFVDVANNSGDALASRQPPESTRRSSRSYDLSIGAGAGPLQVVLSWTDVAGPGVKNVLSLDVQGPAGALVGNHEHTYLRNPLFNAQGLNGIPYDRKNNTQIVYVAAPAPGDYTINVLAYNTPYPDKTQGYALCACGDLASEITPKRPAF